MQFELKTQEQMMAGRQLNVRSKELLTVSRMRMLRENMPTASGALGRLKLTEKDVARMTSWIEDDSVTQDVYNERLDEILNLGAHSDKDALERAGMSSTGEELMSLWKQMDDGGIKHEEAFSEADKAVRRRNASLEKNE